MYLYGKMPSTTNETNRQTRAARTLTNKKKTPMFSKNVVLITVLLISCIVFESQHLALQPRHLYPLEKQEKPDSITFVHQNV